MNAVDITADLQAVPIVSPALKALHEHVSQCKDCMIALPSLRVIRACEIGKHLVEAVDNAKYGGAGGTETPLGKALRDELLKLLQQPLSVGSLRKIGRVVGAAIKTLKATATGVEGLLDTKPKMPGIMGYYGGPSAPKDPDEVDLGLEDAGNLDNDGVYSPAPPIETFGTSGMREIAATAVKFLVDRENKKSVGDLADALAKLKGAGLGEDDPSVKAIREDLAAATGPKKPVKLAVPQPAVAQAQALHVCKNDDVGMNVAVPGVGVVAAPEPNLLPF